MLNYMCFTLTSNFFPQEKRPVFFFFFLSPFFLQPPSSSVSDYEQALHVRPSCYYNLLQGLRGSVTNTDNLTILTQDRPCATMYALLLRFMDPQLSRGTSFDCSSRQFCTNNYCGELHNCSLMYMLCIC